jgi:ribonuclease BN (tRNA processing enzyme)
MERRDVLKAMGATAAGFVAGDAPTAEAADPTTQKNPYGGKPGGGISLPPYYRPTPSVVSRNNYFPGVEKLGKDEMRISFLGSCPFPPRLSQAGTCIMVELGNGDRFFFDFGPGCMRNICAMQVPVQLVNDIFLSHLHVDHYHDIAYLLPFSAWAGRWKPLRVHGPSGATPELGTKAMIAGMKQMMRWHLENFDACPIGDGYEVEVNEFDWKDDNGLCYDKNGVQVRHWRRSHIKDGASAYRLDWNGLSFVWTGDGRPDELTIKCSKGVDVFVSELQQDLPRLQVMKFGIPEQIVNYTVDTSHSPHYAVGYMMKEINPRAGVVTHLSYDEDTVAETVAGVRTHWDGLFLFGAPDVAVVNVTKDAIWSRMAALPHAAGATPPIREMMEKAAAAGVAPPREMVFPNPRLPREMQQEQATRDAEIDPKKYYPPDVARELLTQWPKDFKIDLAKMLGQPPKPQGE